MVPKFDLRGKNERATHITCKRDKNKVGCVKYILHTRELVIDCSRREIACPLGGKTVISWGESVVNTNPQ